MKTSPFDHRAAANGAAAGPARARPAPARSVLPALALLVAAGAAFAHGKPHEHGVVKVDAAVEAGQLTLVVQMPLDNLLGFERAPRTEAERRAAAEALAKMRDGAALFRPDAAAACTLVSAQVEAPVLEAPTAASAGKPAAKDEHADLDGTYVFRCAQPAQLKGMEVGLFDAFRRVQRIEVQAALPGGQRKTVLRRPARQVPLVAR